MRQSALKFRRTEMNPVIEIATLVVAKCIQQGDAMSHDKLQALLFYVQAWAPKLGQNDYFTDSFTWQNALPTLRAIADHYEQIIADADSYTDWPEPDLVVQSVVSFYGKLPEATLLALHNKDVRKASQGQKRLLDGGLACNFMQSYFSSDANFGNEMQHNLFLDNYCALKYDVRPVWVPDITAEDLANVDALLPI